MTRCAAVTDDVRCTVMEGIHPDGLCHYHHKMNTSKVYRFWTGCLLSPTKGIERVWHAFTGKVIYQKGMTT